MAKRYALVVTCEHAGNAVPRKYAALFRGKRSTLKGHRGYDPGALELARRLFSSSGRELFYSNVSRLVVDLNRSPDNPRRFSEFTRRLGAKDKSQIEDIHYLPYRRSVEHSVAKLISDGSVVLHLSAHSFTPVLRGKTRKADVGLLYDPARTHEAGFCARWRKALLSLDGSLVVRMNYPYRGVSDGLTAYLRRKFPGNKCLGIELEVNQKLLPDKNREWRALVRNLKSSLKDVLSG